MMMGSTMIYHWILGQCSDKPRLQKDYGVGAPVQCCSARDVEDVGVAAELHQIRNLWKWLMAVLLKVLLWRV